MHYFDLRGQAEGAIVGAEPMWWGGVPYPERWSYHNFTWYGWNFLNNQVFLPLAVFFFIGLAVALWRLVSRRRAVGYLPELFAGAAVAYVLISLKDLDDPRYTLPVLVYVAIFGTFWLTLLPRALMLAGSTLLAVILVVNLAVFGLGRGHRIAFDTSRSIPSPIRQWTFSVVDPHGYTELGQPVRHGLGDVLEERFRRAREMGFERIVFQPESMNNGGFNLNGLGVLARSAGLVYAGYRPEDVNPNGIYVFRALPEQIRGHEPCAISFDRTGIFFVDGPLPGGRLFCPPET